MPHLWIDNTTCVVTAEELVPEFYKTIDSLKNVATKHAKRGYGMRRVQKGGNGRQLLIDYDSLPNHIQAKLHDPRRVDSVMERFYKVDPVAVDFYSKYRFDDGSYITEDVQERYIINASVLQAAVKLKAARIAERMRTPGGSLKGIMTSIATDVRNFNKVMPRKYGVSHTLPDNPIRFKQKYNHYLRESYESLISKKHGNQNSRVVDERMEALFNSMFAHQEQKPSFAEISRQYDGFLSGYVEVINRETGELYDPKEFEKVSTGTIYGYLNNWQNRLANVTIRNADRQKLMGQFKTPHKLIQPYKANSIISIDDRQPPFEYAKGKRLWLYNGIDLASEAYVCTVFGETKEGIILDFYRQLVRNYVAWGVNLPWELECESSLNASYRDTLLRPGTMFQEVRIEANNARGKRIEQYFNSMRNDLEKDIAGWIARPFAKAERNQARSEKREYVPYNDLVRLVIGKINDWNNMPHNRETQMTRWEYFVANQDERLKPINWLALLKHLGYRTETSVNVGTVNLNRQKFVLADHEGLATGDRLIRLMERVEGQNVDVYWLNGLDGKILKALVYEGGQYVCELMLQPAYNRAKLEQTEEDMHNRELMSKYVMTVESFRNRRVKQVEKVLVVDNTRRTLNNKFSMPVPEAVVSTSLNHHAQSATLNQQYGEAEILPPPPDEFDEDLNGVQRSFVKPMLDRY
jgi:hypothetical protein